MSHATTSHRLALLGLACTAALLSGCGSLRDIDYKWCEPEVASVKPVVTTEKISLNADALFAFDRSGSADMLPAGRAELDALAQSLTSGYARIDSMTLVGHTDRLGSERYNQQLSEARAQTVKAYLQQRGVQAPMTTSGRGKSEPVTTNCKGDRPTTALKACLQPDRRVDVQITGVRK